MQSWVDANVQTPAAKALFEIQFEIGAAREASEISLRGRGAGRADGIARFGRNSPALASDRTLTGVRFAAVLSSTAALLLAGCGDSAKRHSAAQPGADTNATVFTVPDKLPPRAKTPKPAQARHNADTAPARPDSAASSGAPTDAEVQRELARALGLGANANVTDQAGLSAEGYASVPPSAPREVAAIITAGNQVARAPYLYGGGHGGVRGKETWVDSAYDCSGSVSFALASAGLVGRQLDSTSFMSWGKPGAGKWVTVFANHGHAFMVVAGLRFDTVERARTGTRWGQAYSKVTGFAVRHPAGL